jgi:hypothetical protein
MPAECAGAHTEPRFRAWLVGLASAATTSTSAPRNPRSEGTSGSEQKVRGGTACASATSSGPAAPTCASSSPPSSCSCSSPCSAAMLVCSLTPATPSKAGPGRKEGLKASRLHGQGEGEVLLSNSTGETACSGPPSTEKRRRRRSSKLLGELANLCGLCRLVKGPCHGCQCAWAADLCLAGLAGPLIRHSRSFGQACSGHARTSTEGVCTPRLVLRPAQADGTSRREAGGCPEFTGELAQRAGPTGDNQRARCRLPKRRRRKTKCRCGRGGRLSASGRSRTARTCRLVFTCSHPPLLPLLRWAARH